MKNVSIYGKKWLDLVFEGKNKEYGAYQLRQENGKTSTLAFIFGALFLGGFVLLLSSFNEKPDNNADIITDGKIVTVENPFTPPLENNDPIIEQPKSSEPVDTDVPVIPTGEMVVTATANATPDVPTNIELPTTPAVTNGSTTGTAPATNNNTGGTSGTATLPLTTNNLVAKSELDKQPIYPGGIKNFYQYVGDNFDKESNNAGETVRVEVSFVIEKNGTMTDIKILKKTNADIDREAIRVLKSLRTKWTPGYKNGQPVRTLFTLPIAVVL